MNGGLLTAALTTLAAILMLSRAGLTAWQGWLEIRRLEIERGREGSSPISPATRIDLADLKERIRKLEAIAAGVDL
jgi:hypothetical protein